MEEFEINGNKFSSKKSFYKYTEAIFTSNLSWETGRNLNAFADLLQGGFGKHDIGESIKVKWINMAKSREKLPSNFFQAIIDILEGAENVTFEKYEYSS